MLDFFRLIRFPNLLIIAFSQYMMRWFLLMPLLELKRTDFDTYLPKAEMTELDFFLLVLATVMIAAAGYIINDYFDVRIDEVNRPAQNVVGKSIKRRVAMGAHMVINILGVGIGLWLSWKYNQFSSGSFIFITVPALLWFYSTNLKKQFLVGNILIALLSSLVLLLVWLFELPGIYRTFSTAYPFLIEAKQFSLADVLNIGLAYSAFAFIISLLRELVKDTEDYEGDLAYGCRTVPIVLGIARTKWIMAAITAVLLFLIGWLIVLQYQASDFSAVAYFLLLVELPLAVILWMVLKASGKTDWKRASLLIKIVMLTGISFLFLYTSKIHDLIDEVSYVS